MIWNRLKNMKRSRRNITATLLSLYAAIFIFIGVNRATEDIVTFPGETVAQTSPEELAALTGFTQVNARGDFILEVVSAENYSVTYAPPEGDQGNLEARVENGVLLLTGSNNQRNNNRVRIGMPNLEDLTAMFNPEVSVSGFNQDALVLSFMNIHSVTLDSITLDRLEIDARFVDEITMNETNANSEMLDLRAGSTTITR